VAAVVESFAATGIDNALDLLEVVTAKTDKASVGQQAAGIEKHPEVSRLFVIDQRIYRSNSFLLAAVQGERLPTTQMISKRSCCFLGSI
jgi:hypothetical protein